LKGSQYWPLQESIGNDVNDFACSQHRNIAPSTISYRNLSKLKPLTATLDEATTIASTDWTLKTARQRIELDEFELLERQAQLSVDRSSNQTASSQSLHRSTSNHLSTSRRSIDESINEDRDFHPGKVYDDDDDPASIHTMFDTISSFLGDKVDEVDKQSTQITSIAPHSPVPRYPANEDDFEQFRPSSRPRVVHSPPRSVTRESQRWGAVTQPIEDYHDEHEDQSKPSSRPTSGSNNPNMPRRTQSASSENDGFRQRSSVNNQYDEDDGSSTASPSLTKSASRPSLSSRTIRSRPSESGSSRPIIKPPKHLAHDAKASTMHSTPSKQSIDESGANRDSGSLGSSLALKAKELEDELETYKKENIALKQLRKQQEAALEDIAKQKQEMLQSMNEEKLKIDRFVAEQHEQALKDRRAAAKIVRDARAKTQEQGMPASIRQAKQEIDGLQATIEKLKADHEIVIRKHKLNEKRYQQLVKDQQKSIEGFEEKIKSLESDKVALWMFLERSELKIPAALRPLKPNLPPTSGTKSGQAKKVDLAKTSPALVSNLHNSSSIPASQPRKRYGESFAEEIEDLEQLISTEVVSTYYDEADARAFDVDVDDDGDEEQEDQDNESERSDQEGDGDEEGGQGSEDDYVDIAAEMRASSAWSRTSSHPSSNPQHRYGTLDKAMVTSNSEDVKGDSRSHESILQKAFERNPARSPTKETARLSSSQGINLQATSGSRPTAAKSRSPATSQSIEKAPPNPNTLSRTEEALADGTTLIRYRNGTTKQVFADGRAVVNFANGDTKTSDTSTGLVIYYYAQAHTTHTTYPDGLQVYEFPNGQMEKHFPSGRKEITFPDKTKKIIYSNGIQVH
jgi:hypothetical protein